MDISGLSQQFLNLPDLEKLKIIQIGEYVYFNGLKMYNSYENEKELYAAEQKIETIKQLSETQIKSHTESVKEQYSYIIQTKDDVLISKQCEIDELKTRMTKLEEENCQALTVSNKLDSLLGKGNSVDNAMKGDFGESVISNQIQHWYPASQIDDKSGDTARGDLLWSLNDGEFRCLVEVKNVQMVRPTEVQKFERDMLVNTKDGSCNCGIFISIKTENIPNKGKFKLEFINNCPVIYVSNILEDLNTLRFALDSLCSIQNKMKLNFNETQSDDDNMEEFQELMIDFIQKLYNKLNNMSINISQMKNSVESLSSCINYEEKNAKTEYYMSFGCQI